MPSREQVMARFKQPAVAQADTPAPAVVSQASTKVAEAAPVAVPKVKAPAPAAAPRAQTPDAIRQKAIATAMPAREAGDMVPRAPLDVGFDAKPSQDPLEWQADDLDADQKAMFYRLRAQGISADQARSQVKATPQDKLTMQTSAPVQTRSMADDFSDAAGRIASIPEMLDSHMVRPPMPKDTKEITKRFSDRSSAAKRYLAEWLLSGYTPDQLRQMAESREK